jgi:predicted extracellular nuclease
VHKQGGKKVKSVSWQMGVLKVVATLVFLLSMVGMPAWVGAFPQQDVSLADQASAPVRSGIHSPVSISEIRIDQPSTDTDEYFELVGTSGESLDGLTYLVIGDGGGGSGVIEEVTDLTGYSIPVDGHFLVSENDPVLGVSPDLQTSLNFENSDNVTHLLVEGFSGSNGQDLDTNDDGVLDVTPWTSIVDLIALIEEENPPSGTEYHYGPPTIGPDGSYVPGHVYLCADGWHIGQFDPSGGSDTPGVDNGCGGEAAPRVVGTNPGNGAIGVALNADIDISFNEDVNVSGSWFTIECGGSGSHTAAVSGGPRTFTLDPDSDFINCELCVVTVIASQVNDQDTDDPPDYMEEDYVFSFGTSCTCDSIPKIQGFGSSSPCEGWNVDMSGCVTGVTAEGFYIQDTTGDGNPNSSDGIYVYMYSSWTNPEGVQVGSTVTAYNADVQEYYGSTELYNPSSVSAGSSCTLPTPVTVNQITTLGDHDVNHYEMVEFMRVQMTIDGHIQGPTKRFVSRFTHGDPEIGFVYWDNVGSLPNSPRIFEDDYAGYGSLNYLSGACDKDLPDVDFGDRIQATDLVGVMGYHYDKWQLILDESQVQDIQVTDNLDGSDSEAPFAADEFGLCTFNLENLFDHVDDGDGDMGDWTPADQAAYDALIAIRAQDIVNELQSCSVIGVEEVEGKDPVWQDLVDEINTLLGAPGRFAYDYYEAYDPRDIAVGVLYDTSKVTLQSSTQRQGCSSTNYGIGTTYLDNTYGRVVNYSCAGGTPYYLFNRPPYVGTFQVSADGPQFTIQVNHFKSKRGGAEATRPRREEQAAHNCTIASDYAPNVAIVGDLNDGISSSPVGILDSCIVSGDNLVNVYTAHMLQTDRYSYIFSGESSVLDYLFLTAGLDAYLEAASPMHINADYADLDPGESDNCGTGNCPFLSTPRSSDHDPVFVRMNNSPTVVELASFEAIPAAGGILLAWETLSEYNNLGFNLYRSTSGEALGELLNDALIPTGSPGGGQGARYTFLDATIEDSVTYFYTLEDVDASGRRTQHGPVALTLWQFYLPFLRG